MFFKTSNKMKKISKKCVFSTKTSNYFSKKKFQKKEKHKMKKRTEKNEKRTQKLNSISFINTTILYQLNYSIETQIFINIKN